MLPFFFRHYDPIVDTYFVADHGSSDCSPAILASHPRVVPTEFPCSDSSFVKSARDHYNECWKVSRGRADWVIICNIDEHFYHPDLLAYLAKCSSKGITMIRPIGYNMVGLEFPDPARSLQSQIRMGARDRFMDKPQLFDPAGIEDIQFTIGRHSAEPCGRVKWEARPKVKLLHYKYLGEQYLSERSAQLEARMKPIDLVQAWGGYAATKQMDTAREKIRSTSRNAVPVYSNLPALVLAPRVVMRLRLEQGLRFLGRMLHPVGKALVRPFRSQPPIR